MEKIDYLAWHRDDLDVSGIADRAAR